MGCFRKGQSKPRIGLAREEKQRTEHGGKRRQAGGSRCTRERASKQAGLSSGLARGFEI